MQVYTFDEAKKNALEYFNGDDLAATIWVNKYALRNDKNEIIESNPMERFMTIARELDRVDQTYHISGYKSRYEQALINKFLIPAGSGLYGIGNPFSNVSLGNCFVIDGNNEDSIGSIYKVDQESAQIYKRRGGVGTDISHLRPTNYLVSNAAGTTSGPISFAQQHSDTVRRIGQNGRRGALMLSMSINHPNILDFIRAKNDQTTLTGANVSVRVTDEFMQAVENDGYYLQRFPVDLPTISMLDLEPNNVYSTVNDDQYIKVKARDIFDELVRVNWESAEPGILFWDKILRESPADCYPAYKTKSTNPCGELPLSPYDSCRLLSQNLTMFVKNPYTKSASFDKKLFIEHTHLAMRAMDNIIDLELEKLEKIIAKVIKDPEDKFTKETELRLWKAVYKNTQRGRRSGVSLIGHGDFLAMLGMSYGSDEAIDLIEEIHKVHAIELYRTSVQLANERGPFEDIYTGDDSQNPFIMRLLDADKDLAREMSIYGRRNISILTIPPSGSLSILLRQSSGIEPAFSLLYKRRVKINPGEDNRVDYVDETGDSWQEYTVAHPKFRDWFETVKKDLFNLLDGDHLEDMDMNSIGVQEIVEASPWYKSLANDIDPIAKVKMQGRIQKWVDHSISVTHNLPKEATLDTVAQLYLQSWKEGCKGCTVYRDGSRSGVLLSGKPDDEEIVETFQYRDAPKRPRELPCDIYFPKIHGAQYVVLVGLFENKPYEVFAFKYGEVISKSISTGILKKQKSGVYHLLDEEGNMLVEDIRSRFELPDWDFATRMISTALRHGASIDFVVEQLNKAHGTLVTDYIRVIARQLKKYVQILEEGNPCPECGTIMRVEGGCMQCLNCGHGKCG